jgi:hypothetical protein
MNSAFVWTTAELFEMPIKAFYFSKKPHATVILVEYANRVVRVDSCDQPVAGIANCI